MGTFNEKSKANAMKTHKLHIMMFSIHGLLRSEGMELGRDADTGGQINYVVEFGRELANHEMVKKVDLFTRLIADKTVSEDYLQPIEQVSDGFRIIRIQCGGRKYIRKELLWPHLDEYVDKTIKFIKRDGVIPDIVHGHYADAGYVSLQLSELFGIPLVFTAHSLGRTKHQKLLDDGMKEKDIVKKYKIDHRINIEESVLRHANLVITSTNQEIRQQYGMYENRAYPNYCVIPPGVDLGKFYPFYHDLLPETTRDETELHAQGSILQQLNRFFKQPEKPIILALCRPDKKKNISGLIKAYGEDLELQTMANLAVFAGIRKDISDKEEDARDVLTEMLLLMDKYDLYGNMAIPKEHDFDHEVPALYRIAAKTKGVFVNVALTEPFGLTLIEASSCGLPIVATNDGGPKDIVKNLKTGILVDPSNSRKVAGAIKKIIVNNEKWKDFSEKGVLNIQKHYTWHAHTGTYFKKLRRLANHNDNSEFAAGRPVSPIGKRLAKLRYFLITDVDNTLIGGDGDDLKALIQLLEDNHEQVGFAISTGRTVDSATSYLEKHGVPTPDIIIASVGTEIYYGQGHRYDQGWDTPISSRWNRDKIQDVLDSLEFLEYQEGETQRPFKISYYMEPDKDRLTEIHGLLATNKCSYNLIYSNQQFLDILPYRASKGKALRYLSYKWEIPLENILVCGDSGNDEEMLRGEPLGIIVGNYSRELEKLRGLKHMYFAEREFAGGILEGMEHFGFIVREQS
jgi:sucrose-phosphate synthase